MADDLRLPVSNLVRNVLEEAFSVAEQVSGDLGGVLEDVMEGAEEASERYERYRRRRRERRAEARGRYADEAREEAMDVEARFSDGDESASDSSAADLFEGVVAWQPVVLHSVQHCARTGQRMAAGERAYAAIGSHGLTGFYVREDALPAD